MTEKQPMNDKIFVDSNVWLYLFDKDPKKKKVALDLLSKKPLISTQVIAENVNVCLRKLSLDHQTVDQHVANLTNYCEVVLIHPSTLKSALKISKQYQFSFYDSLILAAALETDCTTLYSEDLQDGQVIEGKLRIVNPFVNSI